MLSVAARPALSGDHPASSWACSTGEPVNGSSPCPRASAGSRRVTQVGVHTRVGGFPGLVVPGDPKLLSHPHTPGLAAAVAIAMGFSWGSWGVAAGGQGLFRTLVPRSAGDAAAAFCSSPVPLKAAPYDVGLEAALGRGGSQSRARKGSNYPPSQ